MPATAERVLSRTTKHTIDWASDALGLTYEQVGAAVGANRRTVLRWRKGKNNPSPSHRDRLEKLQELQFLLEAVFASLEEAHEWLQSPVPMLNGQTPASRLRKGDLDSVVEILATLHAGAFV